MQWTSSLDGNNCYHICLGLGTAKQVKIQCHPVGFGLFLIYYAHFVVSIINRNSINGEVVTVEQPIPCRDRLVPPEQVYSYQKYDTDQEHI